MATKNNDIDCVPYMNGLCNKHKELEAENKRLKDKLEKAINLVGEAWREGYTDRMLMENNNEIVLSYDDSDVKTLAEELKEA